MKKLVTKNFILNYDDHLEKFIQQSLGIVDIQVKSLSKLLDMDINNVPQLKASLFSDRQSLVDYVKSISNGRTLPEWAKGCFFNGEIQLLVDDRDKFNKNFLMHEYTHLCIKKHIYDKYNIRRITWFDESYAYYLDGRHDSMSVNAYKEIVSDLKKLPCNFDMNILNDSNLIVTKDYNGNDMFVLIGKYIFENNLEKEYIALLKEDSNKVKEIGKTILTKAIMYIDSIYNCKE